MKSVRTLSLCFILMAQSHAFALVRVADGESVSLKDKSGCTIRFFGPAEYVTPSDNQDSWKAGRGVSRWDCPANADVVAQLPSAGPLRIQGPASVIKFDEQIYVLSGEAITKKGNALQNRILYSGRSTGWSRVKPQPARSEVQSWDDVYPKEDSPKRTDLKKQTEEIEKPVEAPKPVPKPAWRAEAANTDVPIRGSRLMISAFGGFGQIQSEQTEFSNSGLAKGVRAWVNTNGQPHSRLLTVDFLSLENSDRKIADGKSNLEGVRFGWGPRYLHDNDFGFYALFQSGVLYNKVERNYGSYTVRRDRMIVPLGLSVGAQGLLFPGTLRVLAALELSVSHGTFLIDSIQSDEGTVPDGYKVKGNPLIYSIQLHLGPAFQF